MSDTYTAPIVPLTTVTASISVREGDSSLTKTVSIELDATLSMEVMAEKVSKLLHSTAWGKSPAAE